MSFNRNRTKTHKALWFLNYAVGAASWDFFWVPKTVTNHTPVFPSVLSGISPPLPTPSCPSASCCCCPWLTCEWGEALEAPAPLQQGGREVNSVGDSSNCSGWVPLACLVPLHVSHQPGIKHRMVTCLALMLSLAEPSFLHSCSTQPWLDRGRNT